MPNTQVLSKTSQTSWLFSQKKVIKTSQKQTSMTKNKILPLKVAIRVLFIKVFNYEILPRRPNKFITYLMAVPFILKRILKNYFLF